MKPDLHAEIFDHVSLARLSALLGVSERRIQQLVRDKALPAPVARGAYSLEGCIRGFIDYLQARLKEAEPQRVRLDRVRADAGEFALSVKRDDYCLVSDVKAEAFTRARQARDALDQGRARLAPLLAAETDPVRCDQILAREFRHVCEQLSGGKFGTERPPE